MMEIRFSQICKISLLASLLWMPVPDIALAQEAQDECLAAVGTFLTRNRFSNTEGAEHTSRSLISLTNGGHAFRNDSDQSMAENGFSVGEGRGAWSCQGAKDDTVKITAKILNFIYPKEDQKQALIGRMDYAGIFDTGANVLRLKAKLGFVPLEGDPLIGDLPADAIDVEVVGLRVEAP